MSDRDVSESSDVPDALRPLLKILSQSKHRRIKTLLESGRKFAHYTTAENALNILSGRSLWMRNAAVMNDHSEIEHGRGIFDRLLEDPLGDRLWAALDQAHSGISNTIRSWYYHAAHTARDQTHIMSLCEHEPHDYLGRLSMWRAYGGSRASVALVLNPKVVFDPSIRFNLRAAPVLYGDHANVAFELTQVVDNLEASTAAIAAIDADMVAHVVTEVLHQALLSTKHRGFEEEREWRILALGRDLGENGPVKPEIRTIGGIPQIVRIIPLHGHGSDRPANKINMMDAMDNDTVTFLPQLAWGQLIDRIIVGPSLFPEMVKTAIEAQLRKDGVGRWDQLVTLSEIPLRHSG